MKFIKKRYIFIVLMWMATAISFAGLFYFYFCGREGAFRLDLAILGILAMISIALQTFLLMVESTKETVKTILESSNKQILKFTNSIEELKRTNTILNLVASSLKIISEDVVAKQKMMPNLYITFVNNQNQISLRSGEICDVVINLINGGAINASNPCWAIFFPSQIRIVDKGDLDLVPQSIGTRYAGYVAVKEQLHTVNASTRLSRKIKITVAKDYAGLVQIPFACSCDNVPQSGDKLAINFVG